jgi:hypothetical protein
VVTCPFQGLYQEAAHGFIVFSEQYFGHVSVRKVIC